MSINPLFQTVPDLMREAAATFITPRFQSLKKSDIETKSGPADLVTIADREAEEWLTPKLMDILPGSKVVGEEAAAKDPSILSYLSEEGPVWLVDPVDGTANFVEGSPKFAVMVALVHQQETVAGWIYPPMEDVMAVAERGGGAQLDGETLKGRQDTPFDQAYGDYSSKYVASAHRIYLDAAFEKAAGARQGHCSAYAYLDTAKGELDFVMQYLMSPWDHAAGVLLVEEAGGTARFLEDATPYTPVPRNPRPMLAVSDASCWSDYAGILKEKRV